MRISVKKSNTVKISFKGKLNMKQEVTLSENDAKKLGALLASGKSGDMETE